MSNPKEQFRIKLTPEQKAQVRTATGKDAEAVKVDARFARAWAGADVTLTASRF